MRLFIVIALYLISGSALGRKCNPALLSPEDAKVPQRIKDWCINFKNKPPRDSACLYNEDNHEFTKVVVSYYTTSPDCIFAIAHNVTYESLPYVLDAIRTNPKAKGLMDLFGQEKMKSTIRLANVMSGYFQKYPGERKRYLENEQFIALEAHALVRGGGSCVSHQETMYIPQMANGNAAFFRRLFEKVAIEKCGTAIGRIAELWAQTGDKNAVEPLINRLRESQKWTTADELAASFKQNWQQRQLRSGLIIGLGLLKDVRAREVLEVSRDSDPSSDCTGRRDEVHGPHRCFPLRVEAVKALAQIQ